MKTIETMADVISSMAMLISGASMGASYVFCSTNNERLAPIAIVTMVASLAVSVTFNGISANEHQNAYGKKKRQGRKP